MLSASCTEDIIMDVPEGRKVPVVEGSITNECKRHEVILSYSTEMYSTNDPEMITGAQVYLAGGGDTIWYYEQDNKPGHYLTDSVAGRKNRRYMDVGTIRFVTEPEFFLSTCMASNILSSP